MGIGHLFIHLLGGLFVFSFLFMKDAVWYLSKKVKKDKKNNPEKQLEIGTFENILYGIKMLQEKRIVFTTHSIDT